MSLSRTCRIDQESLLRFSEIGWQLLHEWDQWILTCPNTPDFHPTFPMDQEKLVLQEKKVTQMPDGPLKDDYQKFLEHAKSSRADKMRMYKNSPACRGGRSTKSDFNAATKAVKALGVSSTSKYIDCCCFCLPSKDVSP